MAKKNNKNNKNSKNNMNKNAENSEDVKIQEDEKNLDAQNSKIEEENNEQISQNIEDSIVVNDTFKLDQTLKLGFFNKLILALTFAGVALLVYDRVEPGKVPFFKNTSDSSQLISLNNTKSENNLPSINEQVKDLLVRVEEKLSDESQPIINNLESNLNSLIEQINISKNQMLSEFSNKIDDFKNLDLNLTASGAANQADINLQKATIEQQLDQQAKLQAESLKEDFAINLSVEKLQNIKSVLEDYNNLTDKFSKQFRDLKSEHQITSALSQFIKVKKIDRTEQKVNELLYEVNSLFERRNFDGLKNALNELSSELEDEVETNYIQNMEQIIEKLSKNKDKDIQSHISEILFLLQENNKAEQAE